MKSNKCFKPIVGQTLYSLNIGNACRNTEQKLTKVIVIKVGKKYFTCCEKDRQWAETVYYIDSWWEKTEYISNSALYINPEEWEHEKLEKEICSFIKLAFEFGRNQKNISLENLKKIKKFILNHKENTNE